VSSMTPPSPPPTHHHHPSRNISSPSLHKNPTPVYLSPSTPTPGSLSPPSPNHSHHRHTIPPSPPSLPPVARIHSSEQTREIQNRNIPVQSNHVIARGDNDRSCGQESRTVSPPQTSSAVVRQHLDNRPETESRLCHESDTRVSSHRQDNHSPGGRGDHLTNTQDCVKPADTSQLSVSTVVKNVSKHGNTTVSDVDPPLLVKIVFIGSRGTLLAQSSLVTNTHDHDHGEVSDSRQSVVIRRAHHC